MAAVLRPTQPHAPPGDPRAAIVHAARWRGFVALLGWVTLCIGLTLTLIGTLLPLLPLLPLLLAAAAAVPGGGAAPVTDSTLRGVLILTGAAALVAAAGLLPTALLLRARLRVAEAIEVARVAIQQRAAVAGREPLAQAAQAAQEKAQLFSAGEDLELLVRAEEERLERLAGWPQALFAALPASTAVAVVACWWPRAGESANGMALGVAAIIAAFPVLVCERRFAAVSLHELPEAAALARLLRLLLWTLVVGGGCVLAEALGLGFARWGIWALAAAILAVAAELLLRAGAAPFLPPAAVPVALGDSLIAGLLMARLDPLGGAGAFGGGLQERFGIDLSQSWALAFVRRASAPLALALALIAWALSGITVLDVTERGVYECLGAPVAVLPPGLHLHLPWPFGVVRRVENGVVHELALSADDGQELSALAPVGADDEAGAGSDRLWDRQHPSEAFYVVPAPALASGPESGAGQGCQILGSDVRVFYRVGAGDQAARDALYRLEAPEATMRNAAGRLLVGQFATRTLLHVIGSDRDALGAALRAALQADLDACGSGLEVTALAIDSIHPPAQAADAYHAVQAAEISALTDIAIARSAAARTRGEAAQDATSARDQAAAAAVERVAKARGDDLRFNADIAAFHRAPAALALERWLQGLARGLGHGQLTIIDHRLSVSDGPVLDLRRYAPPQATDKR